MVARLLWEQDAAGSSPVTSTKECTLRYTPFLYKKQALALGYSSERALWAIQRRGDSCSGRQAATEWSRCRVPQSGAFGEDAAGSSPVTSTKPTSPNFFVRTRFLLFRCLGFLATKNFSKIFNFYINQIPISLVILSASEESFL